VAGRVALAGGDAATALAEADAVLTQDTDVDTHLTALDIRARALDFLGERAAAGEALTAQAEQAAAAGRPRPNCVPFSSSASRSSSTAAGQTGSPKRPSSRAALAR
jgi:hypothetical protein